MASKPRELTEFGAWSEQKSSSGRKYFYNKDTEVSQWEKPKEWKDHELRLEQERLAAEQRTQPQPPPPPMLFPPPFPPFSANIPPPPGYPSFPMNTPPPFPPPPFAAAPFAPPPVPAVPPPPARVNTHVPSPLVSSQPPALSQPPKTPVTPYAKQPTSSQPSTSKQTAYMQKQAATGAGNPPPPPKQPSSFVQHGSPMLLQQSPYQGSPMIQATTPQQQRSSCRLSQSPPTPVSSSDQKPEVKSHPYATPQSVKHLHAPSVQLTISSQPPPPPQLPAKKTENSRTVAETASGKPVKREWEDAAAGSPKDHTQQTPVKKCKEERVEEEKVAKPEEPWRRFYDANLASKKKAELKLEEDPEMSDIIMQSLALENKLIAELIKVKQAAAMVAVQEHEVLLCQGKIANLQEQQRTIEQRSQNTPAIDLPNLDDLKRQFSQP